MIHDPAVSEIIGALMLIGVIVAAFGMFTVLYLPAVVPDEAPYARLSLGCSDENPVSADTEFPCSRGTFNCHPFDNVTCEQDCTFRDYSQNPDSTPDENNLEISRCKENCVRSVCSDLHECRVLYLCHDGGDPLETDSMGILVNGVPIDRSAWQMKEQLTDRNFTSSVAGKMYTNGDSIRILNPSGGMPVDTVLLMYTLPSGKSVTMVLNQFGTDVI